MLKLKLHLMQRADSFEKTLVLGKIEGRRRRGRQDEMVGWHHRLNGHVATATAVTSVLSDSVRPHRRQPTRLPCPWDSPGKNTGVGCRFLLQCMNVKSESEVAQSSPTLSDPMDCSLPGSSIHGIFQARVLEWGATAFSRKTVWRFLKTLGIKPPYDPAIPLPGIYTEETKIEEDTCTPLFTAALFTIAGTWKQPRCPSTDEQIEKL